MRIRDKNIWRKYTEKLKTVDFSGHPIMTSAFENDNSKYSWVFYNVLSEKFGGKNIKTNIQPISIDAYNQKNDKLTGSIVHNYKNNISIKTEYEVKEYENEYDKQCKYGIIYIKKQLINEMINIENILFYDEIGIHIDTNGKIHFSFLDVLESWTKKCLIFIDGQDPTKWPL